jgi:hypothetical protein
MPNFNVTKKELENLRTWLDPGDERWVAVKGSNNDGSSLDEEQGGQGMIVEESSDDGRALGEAQRAPRMQRVYCASEDEDDEVQEEARTNLHLRPSTDIR